MARTLYAAKGAAASTSDLYTVDPSTGNTTSVGAMGHAMTGLAFDKLTGILYGDTSTNDGGVLGSSVLYTVDTSNGTTTSVGALQAYGITAIVSPDMAFSGGDLYGIWVLSQNLVLIDKATG